MSDQVETCVGSVWFDDVLDELAMDLVLEVAEGGDVRLVPDWKVASYVRSWALRAVELGLLERLPTGFLMRSDGVKS
jgi:hypothetical protein